MTREESGNESRTIAAAYESGFVVRPKREANPERYRRRDPQILSVR